MSWLLLCNFCSQGNGVWSSFLFCDKFCNFYSYFLNYSVVYSLTLTLIFFYCNFYYFYFYISALKLKSVRRCLISITASLSSEQRKRFLLICYSTHTISAKLIILFGCCQFSIVFVFRLLLLSFTLFYGGE